MYDVLASFRFPRRHDFTVNECSVLDVREVVSWLRTVHPQALEHSTVRVTGFIESYHDKTMREAALDSYACERCDGDGCLDCRYTGFRPAYVRFARGKRDLVLVKRPSGATWRWYLLCPACNRRCEHLYLLPGESNYREPDDSLYAPRRGDWRCRTCANVNYTTQHYGRGRARNSPLPPRRALSHQICRRGELSARRQTNIPEWLIKPT